MKTTQLILVGGFLGAGKTTLLFEATNYLMQKGLRIGLITNDQAPELVDTALLLKTHVKVEEVKLHFPDSEVLAVSAKTGEGIDSWLNLMLNSTKSGQRIVEVDYNKYAEGEAALGWLNSTILLHGEQVNWDNFAQNFLTELSKTIDNRGFGVGHVKIMLESGKSYLVGNLTGNIETLNFRGSVGKSNEAQIIINARVDTSPELLEKLVMESLGLVTGDTVSLKTKASQKLSPGYPNPTFRYEKVVDF